MRGNHKGPAPSQHESAMIQGAMLEGGAKYMTNLGYYLRSTARFHCFCTHKVAETLKQRNQNIARESFCPQWKWAYVRNLMGRSFCCKMYQPTFYSSSRSGRLNCPSPTHPDTAFTSTFTCVFTCNHGCAFVRAVFVAVIIVECLWPIRCLIKHLHVPSW